MADRAAIVTGGSSGIGLAIARVLGEEEHALTIAARRPDKLEEAVEGLRADGFEAQAVSGNLGDEEVVRESCARTRTALDGSTCSSTTRASASVRPSTTSSPSGSTSSSR